MKTNVKAELKPLFIFSLPRSGSTLLQRVLTAHSEISSAAEPWLLLPVFYARKEKGVFSEYNHDSARLALEDFVSVASQNNSGRDCDVYQKAIRAFASTMYQELSEENATYFLDKTPRYNLIAEEIIETFPDAKFIFLWRNPLAVASSLIESWGQGTWNLYRYKIDLYSGFENLLVTHAKYQDRSFSMNYETWIESEEVLQDLFNYLELPYDSSLRSNFTDVNFSGRMGDKSTRRELDNTSQDIWQQTFSSVGRKQWAKSYIHRLSQEDLERIGYDKVHILEQLNGTSSHLSFQRLGQDVKDSLAFSYGLIYQLIEPTMFKSKFEHLAKRQFSKLHAHR